MTNFFAKMLDWEVLHSMGVDRWGTRGTRPPTFQLEGVSIGNVLTLFLVHTTNLKVYIARLITPFSYKLYIGLIVKLIKIIRVQI